MSVETTVKPPILMAVIISLLCAHKMAHMIIPGSPHSHSCLPYISRSIPHTNQRSPVSHPSHSTFEGSLPSQFNVLSPAQL